MHKNTRKRAAAVATGAALALIAGGVAYGYWTTGGSGTGSASTGSVGDVTINATSAAVTGLYPGGPAQSISGNFDNPNSGSVYISKVNVAVSAGFSKQADATKPACTAADFNIVQPGAVDAQVPAGTAQGSWTGATIQLVNGAANQDNCKGVTVPLTFTVVN
jgi:hypothetical protein